MLRSLAAVLVAVLIGLTLAKFVEGAAATALSISPPAAPEMSISEGASDAPQLTRPRISAGYGGILIMSWMLAALASAGLALLIGRRWAPLAWLSGATVTFNGLITLLSASSPIWIWPLALAVGPIGAFAAIKVLRGQTALPSPETSASFFE